MRENNAKCDIPIIGNEYHFFDDGKICESRHYIATITDIIKYGYIDKKIKEIWGKEVKSYYWLYASDTDYFIKANILVYDENPIWFARTLDGGWFSLNINNSWQSGRLDIDGDMYENMYEL